MKLDDVRLKLNLDKDQFTRKPTEETGGIMNRLATSQVEISVDELAQAIERGQSFTPALKAGTKGDSWQGQQIIATDIDNGCKKNGKKVMIDNPLSPVDAYEILSNNGIEPAIMYYSFSNRDDWPRYRVLLVLDEPLTDKEKARDYTERLAQLFNQHRGGCTDSSIKDAARLLYGGLKGCVFHRGNDTTPIAALEALPAVKREQPPASRTIPRADDGSTDEYILEALEAIDPADLNYNEWVKIGTALKSGGFTVDVWDSWSRTDARHKPRDCFKRWEKLSISRASVGTIIYMAKQKGWEPSDELKAKYRERKEAERLMLNGNEVFDWNQEIGEPGDAPASQQGQPTAITTNATESANTEQDEQRGAQAPAQNHPPTNQESACNLVRLSDVDPQPPSFLWYPYLRKGNLNLVYGDGGSGKTSAAIAIITALSKGKPSDGMRGCLNVDSPCTSIYLGAEDGIEEYSYLFRMAGADCRYVLMPEKNIPTADDIQRIGAMVKRFDVKLLVFDPLHAHLPDGMDINRANAVRTIMEGLRSICKETGLTVAFIEHTNKASNLENGFRILGSTDFKNAVRSALIVGWSKDGRRCIGHIKGNASELGETIIFDIDEHGKFIWKGTDTDISANDIELTPPSRAKRSTAPETYDTSRIVKAVKLFIQSEAPTKPNQWKVKTEDFRLWAKDRKMHIGMNATHVTKGLKQYMADLEKNDAIIVRIGQKWEGVSAFTISYEGGLTDGESE